jgi:hypothetical protein
MEKAEIFNVAGWQLISAPEARAVPGAKLRCAHCHGAVCVMGAYTQRESYRFAHRRSFDGCGASIEGVPRLHPDEVI